MKTENIREIMSVTIEEGDIREEDGAWYLLKKIRGLRVQK